MGFSEVSNTISGNVKTRIFVIYGDMDLSIPIVLIGNGTKVTVSSNKTDINNPSLLLFY
ncbi:MAG: chemotaxis protein CheX [Candidatus Scalinduaceae bacterium]